MPQSRVAWFKEQLKKYPRIAITGGPRTGKTTLSRWCSRLVFHTDDYKHIEWSKASQKIADDVNAAYDSLLVEGVRVPHALRKGMKVDAVIVLEGELTELTPKQKSMAKATETVFEDWKKNKGDVVILIAPPAAEDYRKESDEEAESD
jgi:hypothetical protein